MKCATHCFVFLTSVHDAAVRLSYVNLVRKFEFIDVIDEWSDGTFVSTVNESKMSICTLQMTLTFTVWSF